MLELSLCNSQEFLANATMCRAYDGGYANRFVADQLSCTRFVPPFSPTVMKASTDHRSHFIVPSANLLSSAKPVNPNDSRIGYFGAKFHVMSSPWSEQSQRIPLDRCTKAKNLLISLRYSFEWFCFSAATVWKELGRW
jgi:hypothetical protein